MRRILSFLAALAFVLCSCSKESDLKFPGNQPFPEQYPGKVPVVEDSLTLDLVFIETPSSTKLLWPFSSPELSGISKSFSVGKASFPGMLTEFRLPFNGKSYSFRIYASTGVAVNSGASQGLKFGGMKDDYMEFPVIAGMAPVEVTLVSGKTGHPGSPMICDENGVCPAGGEYQINPFTDLGDSYTWILYNAVKGVPYRMQLTEDGGIFAQKLHIKYSSVIREITIPEQYKEVRNDTIPDFSRVGYRWGDKDVPDVPVKMTLNAPADGSDALELIQDAIARVQTPGAILLKEGRYNVSDMIQLNRSGVVLRGEGEGTVIYCTAQNKLSTLIRVGQANTPIYGQSSNIIAEYIPVGQMWVPVANPSAFSKGETVFVYRPATEKWLDDIHMREIYDPGDVKQWTTATYSLYWERTVVDIVGDKIYLDNPVVMGIGGDGYGTGRLVKGSHSRISECGIENLSLDTRYDESRRSGADCIDEEHCWSGITVNSVEHSWIRNVTTRHFGYCSIDLGSGAKNITVSGCKSIDPVSQVIGGRRYAFHFSDSQQCIFKDCLCSDDRHQFVCGSRVCGPNVFLRCRGINNREEAGPHQRWSTGILYDNIVLEGGELNIHDRAEYGTGHGWTSANVVLYNCEAGSFVCQSPWKSARNWAIGCIGEKKNADRPYSDNLGPRPDGIWISRNVHVSPASLYESQLEARHSEGVFLVK